MKQYQCARHHLYNAPAGYSGGCPICAAQDAELARTRGLWAAPDGTVQPQPPADAAALPPTVGAYAHLAQGVEPVVGWVACVAGPDRGRDWRLVAGRNAIGRAEGMAVRLDGDAAVSRERHAVISFDPRRGSFSLSPGEGTGLVYCNGQEVVLPVPLAAHDRIELGKSTLRFVPLVGDAFTWTE
jgi:hypothetical protein